MILWKNFIFAWPREENQGTEPGSRDRQILKTCLWKGWQSGPEHFSLEFLIIFPNCQYGGKLPKKARGLLWVELFVGPLCPILGFGSFIPSIGTTKFGGNGRNLNLSFSPSPNILNVFVSCLHMLLAVYSSSPLTYAPPSPSPMNLWSYVAAYWKWKPHIQSDLSLMWNSMLTWQSKWESQTISMFTRQGRQSDAPQTTTSSTLLIVYWWSTVVFAFPNKYKHMSPFFIDFGFP